MVLLIQRQKNQKIKTGDFVQDGTKIDSREFGGGSRDLHASKQALHPGRDEIHRNRQRFSVSVFLLFQENAKGANVRYDTGPSPKSSCRFRPQGESEECRGQKEGESSDIILSPDLFSGLISATVARVGASS